MVVFGKKSASRMAVAAHVPERANIWNPARTKCTGEKMEHGRGSKLFEVYCNPLKCTRIVQQRIILRAFDIPIRMPFLFRKRCFGSDVSEKILHVLAGSGRQGLGAPQWHPYTVSISFLHQHFTLAPYSSHESPTTRPNVMSVFQTLCSIWNIVYTGISTQTNRACYSCFSVVFTI